MNAAVVYPGKVVTLQKEQATFIKASQALILINEDPLLAVQTKIDCGNRSIFA